MRAVTVLDEKLNEAAKNNWKVIEIRTGYSLHGQLIEELAEIALTPLQPLQTYAMSSVTYNHIPVIPSGTINFDECAVVGYPDTRLGRILFEE